GYGLDPDTVAREPDRGVEQGLARAAGALVGDVRDVGQAGVGVDDDLEVVVADPDVAMATGVFPAEGTMAAAVRDPAQLLVVLVDERAWVVVDVPDRYTREAVGVTQAAVPETREHGVHGRAGLTQERTEAVRSPAPVHPGRQDRPDRIGRGLAGRAVRSRAAVFESSPTLGPIPPDPLVGRRSTDSLGLSGRGGWPALELDPRDQELSAEDVETRRTMGHESFLPAWVLNTPNHG